MLALYLYYYELYLPLEQVLAHDTYLSALTSILKGCPVHDYNFPSNEMSVTNNQFLKATTARELHFPEKS